MLCQAGGGEFSSILLYSIRFLITPKEKLAQERLCVLLKKEKGESKWKGES